MDICVFVCSIGIRAIGAIALVTKRAIARTTLVSVAIAFFWLPRSPQFHPY
ncbi:MAG: hypothetical protein SAJ37_09595 [Oscillatoria sp. PMC 1068.18]|nr:hypothetical protein [Oscillatoria sp. PMC 1076.18]MEC4988988.1 hypothetical protein [Oscillatoria sp. PMC 1068.18]